MEKLEQLLKDLFDYQKYEKNSELDEIVSEVINKYDNETVVLSDFDLSLAIGGKKEEDEIIKKDPLDDK